jgi:mRNA-degrading endonuclease toxin of MazEF toxin-antitoxin module
LSPGDIVIAALPGAKVTKSRPAVVLSTAEYQKHRPDVVLGLITTRLVDPASPTDCRISAWRSAGLHAPSWFRLFLVTLPQRDVRRHGRLSDGDWTEVRVRVEIGLAGSWESS